MIEVSHVKKEFGNVCAVDDISLTAKGGEIFGLLGPNGAGKSTTIRMIMDILRPDSGQILFDGKPMQAKDSIGYLPEERGLYKKVKVGDILQYFGSLKNRSREYLTERIDYWLKKFDLQEWKDHPVSELSKGMSQKVQFICSVLHDPEFIFFDEPFSGLDPVSSDMLRESIHELGKQGKTILFSTHLMENAEKICHRILLMNKGRSVVSGTMQEIKDHYGQKSVAVEFDGDPGVIRNLPMVSRVIEYPRYCEVELTEPDRHPELLKILADKITIRKYELLSPSLHKIFVDLVGTHTEDEEEQNA